MAKALALNEIRRRGAQFALEWRDSPGDERQDGQSFVRDLLQVFGVTATKAALYEKRAKRSSTGGRGYIDALVPGLCAIEMKSSGKDLEAAISQAMDYIDDLTDAEAPRYVIASDFRQFRVLDLLAPEGTDVEAFTLEELPARIGTLAFLAGYQRVAFGDVQQETASVKAARIMANLYEALADSGYDDHEASVFLVRVLFCLYADDAGVWERDLFYEFLERRTSEDGSDLGPQLAMLFQVMNRDQSKRQKNLDELLARFPYVNGGIFAEPAAIPSFDRSMRDLLVQACAFNWSGISPAIFGSLFQAVKDAKARRDLGEHYTTETNILKTIQPLFLDELRERFTHDIHDVARLKRLRADLGQLRVMDPSCGGGNFLNVAYAQLREIETDVLAEKRRRSKDYSATQGITMSLDATLDQKLTIDRFYGIEINWWPAKIAETAMFLVDHQANLRLAAAIGQAPERLPITITAHITHGNALRLDWEEILPEPAGQTFIFGNPPFLGDNTRDAAQLADMRHAWGNIDQLSRLDFVTSWHAKALQLYRERRGAFAFVTTNSITQGDQVPRLFGLIFGQGWRVAFAHRTFAWDSQAPGQAAVPA